MAKTKRVRGEEYTSPTTGKLVPARVSGPDSQCRCNCFDRISEGERTSIPHVFYQLASKDLQDAHLWLQPSEETTAEGTWRPPHKVAYTYSVCAVFFVSCGSPRSLDTLLLDFQNCTVIHCTPSHVKYIPFSLALRITKERV